MDFTPLHYACIQDDISAIISLLREGAAVNVPAGDLSPLHVAASSGHAETCQLLLSAGANVDAQFPLGDMSALHYAAREGQEGVVRILLDAGADVNLVPENGQTALHKAAARMVRERMKCRKRKRSAILRYVRFSARIAAGIAFLFFCFFKTESTHHQLLVLF
jgi:ankyrin repeat protein